VHCNAAEGATYVFPKVNMHLLIYTCIISISVSNLEALQRRRHVRFPKGEDLFMYSYLPYIYISVSNLEGVHCNASEGAMYVFPKVKIYLVIYYYFFICIQSRGRALQRRRGSHACVPKGEDVFIYLLIYLYLYPSWRACTATPQREPCTFPKGEYIYIYIYIYL